MTKTLCLTGASGDIGRAIVEAVLDDFDQLILQANAQYKKCLDWAKKLAEKHHKQITVIQADFSSQDGIQAFCKTLQREKYQINAFVHNAGQAHSGIIQSITPKIWSNLQQVHLESAFFISQAILPELLAHKNGNILFISSIWGAVGASCEVAYSAVKAGLIGLTKALADELGPSGIRVNCLLPGLIDTRMNAAYSDLETSAFLENVPLGRMGNPDEVAKVVQFMLSEDAAYITGQNLCIDGGYL